MKSPNALVTDLPHCWQGSVVKWCVLLLLPWPHSAGSHLLWIISSGCTYSACFLPAFPTSLQYVSLFDSWQLLLCRCHHSPSSCSSGELWESALQAFLSVRSYNKPWMLSVKKCGQTHTSTYTSHADRRWLACSVCTLHNPLTQHDARTH